MWVVPNRVLDLGKLASLSHPALSNISPIVHLHPSFQRPEEETDLGVLRHRMPPTD